MSYRFSRPLILFYFGHDVSLKYNPDLYHVVITIQAFVHMQFRDGLCLFDCIICAINLKLNKHKLERKEPRPPL
jgi:hypothetical protein